MNSAARHHSGCLPCGAELVYHPAASRVACDFAARNREGLGRARPF